MGKKRLGGGGGGVPTCDNSRQSNPLPAPRCNRHRLFVPSAACDTVCAEMRDAKRDLLSRNKLETFFFNRVCFLLTESRVEERRGERKIKEEKENERPRKRFRVSQTPNTSACAQTDKLPLLAGSLSLSPLRSAAFPSDV